MSTLRKSQVKMCHRSDKIRTYNFNQSRITDHETGLEFHDTEKFLLGEYLMNIVKHKRKIEIINYLENLASTRDAKST